MKILIVTQKVSENGGIERYTVEIIRRLSLNHKVFVLAQKVETRHEGVTYFVKNFIHRPVWLNTLAFSLISCFWVAGIRRSEGVDLVLSNGCALAKTDVTVAHSCHRAGIISGNKLRKAEQPGIRTNIRCFLRWFWPHNIVINSLEAFICTFGSRKIVAVSGGVKNELMKILNISDRKVAVIPNGVDSLRFKPNDATRESVRKELSIDDEEIVLIFSGHEFGRKGLGFVIEALAASEFDKWRLVVIGGDNREPYQRLAASLGVKDKVVFIGRVAHGIEKFYSAGDLFVFPTGYEAFSLATLEAAASGLPLLLTRVNGTAEILSEGVNGYFIGRNKDSIRSKLDMLSGDREVLRRMGFESRKKSLDFSWENNVRQLEELLTMMISHK